MTENGMIIGGERVGALAGTTWDLVDPGTEDVIDQVPYGAAGDAAAAVDAAAAAFPAWSRTTAYQRAAILERAAELLVERADTYAPITTLESGKPLAQARAEWLSAPNYLRYAAGEALRLGGRWIPSRAPGRRIDVTYSPLGVIGIITAWNFPVYNVNRAAASALAAGNTVVIRPSEYTPRTALLYGQTLLDAGMPPGVVNVVNGDPAGMAGVFLDDPRVRKIAFTGSVRVGKLLMEGASRTITRLALELGGNAPVIVFPDVADIDAVAASAVTAKTRNGGQACIAPQRFYVHASIADRFTKAAADAARAEKVGHGLDGETTVGPLINAAQLERVASIVEAGAGGGSTVVTGGKRLQRPGYFYPPTVLSGCAPDAPVMTEEVFGPVMPISPFDRADEAIAAANATEYGLAAFVWTADLHRALDTSDALDYGLIGINDWYPVAPEAPFGGMKQSGLGRESGTEGLHEYVEAKTRFFGAAS